MFILKISTSFAFLSIYEFWASFPIKLEPEASLFFFRRLKFLRCPPALPVIPPLFQSVHFHSQKTEKSNRLHPACPYAFPHPRDGLIRSRIAYGPIHAAWRMPEIFIGPPDTWQTGSISKRNCAQLSQGGLRKSGLFIAYRSRFRLKWDVTY